MMAIRLEEEKEKDVERAKEGVKQTLKSLLDLVPASNELVAMLRESDEKPLRKSARRYPEYLQGESLTFLSEFLGISIKEGTLDIGGGRYGPNTLGSSISDIVNRFQKALDDDEFREELGAWLGIEIKNPRLEYAKRCLEALEDDELSIGILRSLLEAGEDTSVSVPEVADELESLGIEVAEKDVKSKLDGISSLEIISKSGEAYKIREGYGRHLEKVLERE